MKIGGLEKLSLLDYPDCLAAVVFTQGCNFRCHFCYNPMLVWPQNSELDKKDKEKDFSSWSEKDFFLFLKSRLNKLEAVVISGGEPTLQADLPQFIRKIKKIGLLVKLDTNGTNPKMLLDLWQKKLIDYVAMDLKSSWKKYEKVIGRPISCRPLQKSVKILIDGQIPHEFRSTLVPGLHTQSDIKAMGQSILGARAWYLQKFKSNTGLVNFKFENKKSFTNKEMKEFVHLGRQFVTNCQARGLDN